MLFGHLGLTALRTPVIIPKCIESVGSVLGLSSIQGLGDLQLKCVMGDGLKIYTCNMIIQNFIYSL